MAPGVSIGQREVAGQEVLRAAELARDARSRAAAAQNSSTISRSASPVADDRVSVSATMSPLRLEGVELGRRAVGQAAIGPQHAEQPVRALAAEDADGQVERQVVGMRPRNRRCARRESRSAPSPADR